MIPGSKPFNEIKISESEVSRVFASSAPEDDLIWHRDREDREITVVNAGGWYFQKENQLPFALKNGDVIFIKKAEYHRVIKGSGALEISVKKLNRSERSFRVEKILEIIKNER